ncbi:hypothetical protein RJT34_22965 [Clitoria ternatea]|uniref:Uncharacterized protein n=1 Tax=Clitoria ternatea TaxID=43366 RepID=A0AAN9IHZ0_CLITE
MRRTKGDPLRPSFTVSFFDSSYRTQTKQYTDIPYPIIPTPTTRRRCRRHHCKTNSSTIAPQTITHIQLPLNSILNSSLSPTITVGFVCR